MSLAALISTNKQQIKHHHFLFQLNFGSEPHSSFSYPLASGQPQHLGTARLRTGDLLGHPLPLAVLQARASLKKYPIPTTSGICWVPSLAHSVLLHSILRRNYSLDSGTQLIFTSLPTLSSCLFSPSKHFAQNKNPNRIANEFQSGFNFIDSVSHKNVNSSDPFFFFFHFITFCLE